MLVALCVAVATAVLTGALVVGDSMRFSLQALAIDREILVVALVSALDELMGRWREHDGDVHASGLAAEVDSVCSTLLTRVRVELPGGDEVTGTARRLGPDGALVVVDDAGTELHVRAGDVHHIRAM